MRSGRLSMTLPMGGIRGKNNALRILLGTATVLTFALTEIEDNLARRLLKKNGPGMGRLYRRSPDAKVDGIAHRSSV